MIENCSWRDYVYWFQFNKDKADRFLVWILNIQIYLSLSSIQVCYHVIFVVVSSFCDKVVLLFHRVILCIQVLKSLVVPLNSLIVLICEASVCRTRGSWKRQFNLLIKIASSSLNPCRWWGSTFNCFIKAFKDFCE